MTVQQATLYLLQSGIGFAFGVAVWLMLRLYWATHSVAERAILMAFTAMAAYGVVIVAVYREVEVRRVWQFVVVAFVIRILFGAANFIHKHQKDGCSNGKKADEGKQGPRNSADS